MTDNEILKVAAAAGIDKAAMVDADDLVFEYEFRKYCVSFLTDLFPKRL